MQPCGTLLVGVLLLYPRVGRSIPTGAVACGPMTDHVRRIDRILAPEYAEGLDDRSIDELRVMERDCLEVETEISYVRRLAQGRLDILEAERDRRAAGGPLGDLIAALPRILSAESGRSGAATTRAQPLLGPADSIRWNRGLERLVTDATLVNLPNLSDAELQATMAQLRELEQDVSERRRELHAVLDTVTHAVAARLATAG